LATATSRCRKKPLLGGEKKFKMQMAKGKWQMENHLRFAICHLPFELLVSG
jgi:hypothetical protein